MAKVFDAAEQWPELFSPLNREQRHAVVQSLAVAGHEGWVPTREQVQNLVDRAAGSIDAAEYSRRSELAARRGVAAGRH